VLIVPQLVAQFPDTLHQRVIRYGNVWPNHLVKLLLRDKASSVLHKIAQDLKRLWSQVDVLIRAAQTPTRQVQRKAVEMQNPRVDLVHLALRRSSSCVVSEKFRPKI